MELVKLEGLVELAELVKLVVPVKLVVLVTSIYTSGAGRGLSGLRRCTIPY